LQIRKYGGKCSVLAGIAMEWNGIGMAKMTHKKRKEISCFEVMDVLF
jgi:hypothetical protein